MREPILNLGKKFAIALTGNMRRIIIKTSSGDEPYHHLMKLNGWRFSRSTATAQGRILAVPHWKQQLHNGEWETEIRPDEIKYLEEVFLGRETDYDPSFSVKTQQ